MSLPEDELHIDANEDSAAGISSEESIEKLRELLRKSTIAAGAAASASKAARRAAGVASPSRSWSTGVVHTTSTAAPSWVKTALNGETVIGDDLRELLRPYLEQAEDLGFSFDKRDPMDMIKHALAVAEAKGVHAERDRVRKKRGSHTLVDTLSTLREAMIRMGKLPPARGATGPAPTGIAARPRPVIPPPAATPPPTPWRIKGASWRTRYSGR